MKIRTALLILALATPLAAQGPQRNRGDRGPNPRAMDTNNDGKISKDEWKGSADVFDRLDANHDGYLTREEGPNPRNMDSNKDGKISKDEWKGPADMFDRMDTNHDGSISSDEFRNGRRGQGQRPERGRGR